MSKLDNLIFICIKYGAKRRYNDYCTDAIYNPRRDPLSISPEPITRAQAKGLK